MKRAQIQQVPLHKNTEKDRMRNHISFSVSFLISALFTGFGIVNLIIGRTYAGLFESGAGIIILVVNILVFRYKKSNFIPAITLSFITVLLSLYLYWNGGFGHTGIFWCLDFSGAFCFHPRDQNGDFLDIHASDSAGDSLHFIPMEFNKHCLQRFGESGGPDRVRIQLLYNLLIRNQPEYLSERNPPP